VPTVLLIRHAQASYGAADYDLLSERGIEQADALRRALTGRGIEADLVVTGSLKRQRDTAQPWTESAATPAMVDPGWNEYDDEAVLSEHSTSTARVHRVSDGRVPTLSSRDFQVVVDEALQGWIDAGPASRCWQTWPQFLGQINQALDAVVAKLSRGETALVFSSSGVIAALSGCLIGVPDQAFVALNRVSVNTAVTKLIVGGRGRTLVTYNDHSHLEEASATLLTYR
jgi:broad specificity phosphatase PhoE